MSRYTGPKNKLARRIGENLGLKQNALKVGKRIELRPGMHGKKMQRKLSGYAQQLKEKQKVRFIYGVTEKQLQALYQLATKTPAATGTALLRLLERRLDNTLYRMKFAPTRAGARQIVNHGHVMVNGKKMSIPSYRVQVDDVIALDATAQKIPAVHEIMQNGGAASTWTEVKGGVGKVVRYPERDEIDGAINEQQLIEFYSR
jgi:small subunit ribosomal protein S4